MSRTLPDSASAWRATKLDRFLIGAPHYPEHVDPSLWERDADLMAEAGFNVTRLGEFAWHLFEPSEGRFDFDLFDRAIESLGRRGISTILCTPTATPPRWLTFKHPEVLRVDANGRIARHGSRQHADTTSPRFREYSRKITEAMASHYAENPNVIAWQTDNELNTTSSLSYSPSAAEAFRSFLIEHYASIADLNSAWGGHFWATAYDSVDQIDIPIQGAPSSVSPGHMQDFHRFLAAATARFQDEQIEILRAANADWMIFHNLGNFSDMDLRGSFSRNLDFLGFDIYPSLYDEFYRRGGLAVSQAFHLDVARGYAGNFLVPEHTSGLGSQPGFTTLTPEPGEMNRMAMSSVARGADGLMFFRWRPAHFGAEIYWMGILDHDSQPRRRYREATTFASDIKKIAPLLLGTSVRIDLGIAGADFDNQEAHKTYPIGLPSPLDDALILYRAAYARKIASGFVHPEDDLSHLKVYYVPHWVMWKPEWTPAVRKFVEDGGILIVGAMTGTRNSDNHVHTQAAPGAGLDELLGVRVLEFGRLSAGRESGLSPPRTSHAGDYFSPLPLKTESMRRVLTLEFGDISHEVSHLYEAIDVTDEVEVIGRWSDRFLAMEPAVTRRTVGKGAAIYVATYLTDSLATALLDLLEAQAGLLPLLQSANSGVEVSLRESETHRLLFVLNTTEEAVDIKGLPSGIDLISDQPTGPAVEVLAPYAYKVIKLPYSRKSG